MSVIRIDQQISLDHIIHTLLEGPIGQQQVKDEDIQEALTTPLDPEDMTQVFSVQNHQTWQWKVKRLVDILGTSIGLIFILPILAAVAILIKLDSKGPIFYKQTRIGLFGQKFEMYKFRSMHIDADERLAELKAFNESNSHMFKMANDPRITRIGKYLRKFSIDELPQLLNVLKGEMSLVGPRPPVPSEVAEYEPWHYVRFATLPGLTGLWQVSGRSSIMDFNKVVELDFKYIKNWTLFLDTKILFQTIPVVIFGKDTA
jgi:exopolysaccharide biosynthesis polyprenyl glycosylphosphotransferase